MIFRKKKSNLKLINLNTQRVKRTQTKTQLNELSDKVSYSNEAGCVYISTKNLPGGTCILTQLEPEAISSTAFPSN